MKKVKEDAEATRAQLIEAAFECFDECGYRPTSLDTVAKRAGVTRGALYWHFKDKKDLFEQVCFETLENANVINFAYSLPDDMSYEDRLCEIFWWAQNDNKWVKFIYRIINIVTNDSELSELQNSIQVEKTKLFRFFVEETRMHIRMNSIENAGDPEDYGSTLMLLFEGMFLLKNFQIGMNNDREHLNAYVRLVISDLL